MSGHSKWANIKNKKAKTDAVRGKIFTKIGKEIAVAAKAGADPATNSKLADVIAKAKAANMPNDNIARAIKKAAGEGSAVIVKTLTDNKNRTVGDVRHVFDKYGGSLGSTGSVSYMFEQKGVIVAERTLELDEDTMMEIALEAGADDVLTEDDCYTVYTNPSDFSDVRKFLESKGVNFIEADIEMVPNDYITLDEKQTETFMKMLDALEDNDDVQSIYHNVNLPEEEDED